jgi:C-terminal processing protease CtpA/Prc
LFIDGVEARRMTPNQLHQALSGPLGEPVKITLVRNGEVMRVTVTRTEPKPYRLEGEPAEAAPPRAP